MFKALQARRLLAVAALAAMAAPAWATPATIDFEPGFVTVDDGATFVEKGVRFTPTGGGAIIDPSFCDPVTEFCAIGNGTSFFTALNDSVVAMSADRWIDLVRFDASFYPSPFINFSGSDVRLQVDAVTMGGQAVSQTFQLNEEAGGTGNFVFETFDTSPDFRMLRSVSFSVCFQNGASCDRPSGPFINDAQFSLDNIVLGIPEPSAALLLALGLCGLAANRRRPLR